MKSEDASNLRKTLFNRENWLSIYLPGAIAILANSLMGLAAAVIVSAIYAFIISYFSKGSNKNGVIIIVFLLFELALTSFAPEKWPMEITLYFKMIANNVIFSIIFLWPMLANKPLPQLFTEKIYPELKAMSFSQTKAYVNIFKKISLFWIAGFLLKICILIGFYPPDEKTMIILSNILFIPFYVCWSIFGFLYGNSQLKKLESTSLTQQSQ